MMESQFSLIDLVNEETNDIEDEAPIIFQDSPYYNEENLNELFNTNIYHIYSYIFSTLYLVEIHVNY
jgi:hypothetical protein